MRNFNQEIGQMLEEGMSNNDAAIVLTVLGGIIEYSSDRYDRLRRGIHTRSRLDDLVSWLVKNECDESIDWIE